MQSKPKASIIGQGYVGLPLAMAAAESGLQVTGIDVDLAKVSLLSAGQSPIEDVTDDRLQSAIKNLKYEVTSNFSKIAESDVVVICVPTPLDVELKPDLRALKSAVNAIIPYLREGMLIISESTSYPGTLREVIYQTIRDNFSQDITKLYFASAPERVNPGDQKWDITNTPRLVGGLTPEASKIAKDFYQEFCKEVVVTETPEVAESAKILENTFRLVNIALMHEFNHILSAQGIDTNAVVDAASTKPYGFMPFRSGVGIGGHCIPVDPMYLTWWARENGSTSRLVELAGLVSRSMPKYVAGRALSLIDRNSVRKRVLVLGVAYKQGLADTRETPASELIAKLREEGAEVKWHDPLVGSWGEEQSSPVDWECDIAILATNQPGISINSHLERGIPVLDCTNSYRGVDGVIAL